MGNSPVNFKGAKNAEEVLAEEKFDQGIVAIAIPFCLPNINKAINAMRCTLGAILIPVFHAAQPTEECTVDVETR